MLHKKIISTVAVVAIVASILAIISNLKPPKADIKPYEALGWGAAEETAKFLNNRGNVVVVYPNFGNYKVLNPRFESLLKSFKKALSKNKQITLVNIEQAPVEPPSMSKVGIYLPSEQFDLISQKYAKASAIVSFVGIPTLSDKSIQAVKENGARWVVVLESGLRPDQQLKNHAIFMAIVPRAGESGKLSTGRTLRERFDQEYEVIQP